MLSSRNRPTEGGSERLHLEAQILASLDKVARVGSALDQQVTGRGARLEIALELRMLADRRQDLRRSRA